jgi:uncharacterized protein (DUF58 family)
MAIKDLTLAAKTTVDGFMSGINKSNVKGSGIEFNQYRSYQPGDDLRSLDWKMFARSDRYFIRESEVETSIAVRFLIDASGSMEHQDGAFTKLKYARYLAASLGYLAHQQGDAIGLYVFKEGDLFTLPVRRDHQHLARFIYQLEQIKAGGTFTEPVRYKDIFSGTHKRELLIFITDMYQTNNELFTLLDSLAALRHEIIVFHVMAANEFTLDYKNYTGLQDMETGEVVRIDATETRKVYEQKLEQYLADVRLQLLDRKIAHRLMRMDKPVDQALRDFLNQRNKVST